MSKQLSLETVAVLKAVTKDNLAELSRRARCLGLIPGALSPDGTFARGLKALDKEMLEQERGHRRQPGPNGERQFTV